jgi:hypothetical protein
MGIWPKALPGVSQLLSTLLHYQILKYLNYNFTGKISNGRDMYEEVSAYSKTSFFVARR